MSLVSDACETLAAGHVDCRLAHGTERRGKFQGARPISGAGTPCHLPRLPLKQRLLLKSVEMGRDLMAAGGNEQLAYNHVLSLADLARALDKGGHPEKALQVSHQAVRYIPLIPRARERQLKKCAGELVRACDQFHE